jgi:hypothetical protein
MTTQNDYRAPPLAAEKGRRPGVDHFFGAKVEITFRALQT